MEPDGDGTKVVIDTDLKISGKVAQFGKGTMVEVSEKLLGQFVECVEQTLLGEQVVEEVAAASAAEGVAAAPPRPTPQPVEELDLLDVAGGSVAKRVAPIIGVILVLILLKMIFGGRSDDD